MNRKALVILILAALVIFGGIKLGNMVESMATEIADTRTAALADF